MALAVPPTVDLDERAFQQACADLAGSLDGFEPDLLVGIATGGTYVAEAMAPHVTGAPPIAEVRLQRAATGVKERVGIGRLLQRLPQRLTNILRWLEVEFRELTLRRKGTLPLEAPPAAVDPSFDAAVRGAASILVVDDTVDSGRTLATALDIVRRRAPEATVRTAVLTSTFRRPPVRPDYCLHDRVLIRFPWSFDS